MDIFLEFHSSAPLQPRLYHEQVVILHSRGMLKRRLCSSLAGTTLTNYVCAQMAPGILDCLDRLVSMEA